ncbi:MAG TPA: YkvA family protein [Rubrobacteraceae bacterium]
MVGVNLGEWKRWAGRLKSETHALYLAYRDPRVPWYAKLFAALVVGYAFSPIDLIPDAIPVLGYLDDLILVPLGVALAVRMIPEDVLSESRQKAREMVERGERPVSRAAAAVIVVLWLALAVLGILVVVRMAWG